MDRNAPEPRFARALAGRYAGPAPERPIPDEELVRDALWLLTSRGADEREMALYVLGLGSPLAIADVYVRLRGHEIARDDIARMVQAELALLERPSDAVMLQDAKASRRAWADTLFQALAGEGDELWSRVKKVESRVPRHVDAGRR